MEEQNPLPGAAGSVTASLCVCPCVCGWCRKLCAWEREGGSCQCLCSWAPAAGVGEWTRLDTTVRRLGEEWSLQAGMTSLGSPLNGAPQAGGGWFLAAWVQGLLPGCVPICVTKDRLSELEGCGAPPCDARGFGGRVIDWSRSSREGLDC